MSGTVEFDQLIQTINGEIEQLLAAGELEQANKLSYNLSADLAECWPDDERPREVHHLHAGLAAAERCLEWRRQQSKGPRPFAIAHWVHGMHLLSLAAREANGQALATAALGSFEASVKAAVAHAQESGTGTAVDARGDYLVILNNGFVGLAREMRAPGSGAALVDEVRRAFEAQAAEFPAKAEEARFGIANLDVVAKRLVRK